LTVIDASQHNHIVGGSSSNEGHQRAHNVGDMSTFMVAEVANFVNRH
jgi:hypothetical protein|tara:strand:- start:4 stop:144 length:141 start_codon:yes stop_codon:yes gene_type:complete